MKTKTALLWAALLLLSACQTFAPADSRGRLPLSNEVTTGYLDNGIRYYIHPNGKPKERAYITLLLNVGSLQEADDERGAAHFVEHMAFNGSTHFDKNELISTLESLGMSFGSDINAFTSYDNTRYHLEIPTDDFYNWGLVALILEDWMTGIQFDAEEVDKERKVILSEKRARKGLGERIYAALTPINFGDARHGKRLPIGTDETLKQMTPEQLKAFYQKWYQPHNMALIISGDVDPQIAIKLFNNTIGKVKATSDAKPQEYLIPNKNDTSYLVIKDPEILDKSLNIRYQTHSVTLNNYDALRYRLLNQMVVTIFNQRMIELVNGSEKPFESASLSHSQLGNDKLLFNFSMTPKLGQLAEGYQRLIDEIHRIQQHGFLDSEANRFKNEVLVSSQLALQDQDTIHSRGLTERYMAHFLYGEHYFSTEQRHKLLTEILPTITADEVSRHFNRLLQSQLHSIVVYAPEQESLPDNLQEQLIAALSSDKRLEPYSEALLDDPLLTTLPNKGSIVAVEAMPAVDAQKYTLSNGATVIVRPSDLAQTEVLLTAFAPGGYSLASEQQQRSAMESAKLVAASGIGQYSRTDLGKKLSDKAIRLNLNMGRYFAQLSASSSPDDMELMFQLIYLYFTEPKVDPDIAENYRQSVMQYQRNRLNDPEQKYADELHRLLTNNHPKSQPWSVEEAKKIDAKMALEFYRQRFSKANNFTFVIVGNIQKNEIEPLLEQYIASLPASEQTESWVDEQIRQQTRNITFERATSLDGKTKVVLQYHKPIPNYISETRFKLGLYQELLQQQLQATLREDLGEVYSIGVSAGIERYPTRWFNLLISFNSEPGREQLVIETIEQIIEQSLSEPLPQDKLENIKRQRKVAFEESQQNNGFWLGQITTYERDNIDYYYFTSYLERLDKVTADEIQQTAQALFKDSYRVTSIMRPQADDEVATQALTEHELSTRD